MTRQLAAMVLTALLLSACDELPSEPYQGALPEGSGGTQVPPISISSSMLSVKEAAVLWNAGCFDSDDYERHWTFSDGATAEGPTIVRRFAEAGTYTVTLVTRSGTTEHTHTATLYVIESGTPDSLQPEIRPLR